MRLIRRGSGSASAAAFGAVLGVYKSEMAALFIVIPRRCSSSRKSMNRSFPASFWLMKPLCAMRPSLRVVFPWSTCARTHMLRMFSLRLCRLESRSTARSISTCPLLSSLTAEARRRASTNAHRVNDPRSRNVPSLEPSVERDPRPSRTPRH